jgi:hypothetical protein
MARIPLESAKVLLALEPGECLMRTVEGISALAGKKLRMTVTSTCLDVRLATFAASADMDSVRAVFDHWHFACGKTSIVKLSPKRIEKIRCRLGEGFTVEQLCAATDAMLADPFYNDPTPGATRYNDIELVCRTRDHVERFLERAAEQDTVRRQTLRDRIKGMGG